MFLRLVADSFSRRPRHKLLTGAALALGMAVATAALSVSLDVGDRLAREFRSLGANLVVTPQGDSLPLEIGGVDYRPANSVAYLPESDLPKISNIFWHNNIVAYAPVLDTTVYLSTNPGGPTPPDSPIAVQGVGTWASQSALSGDVPPRKIGIDKTNPWFHVDGRWFSADAGGLRRVNLGPNGHTFRSNPDECVLGTRLAARLNLHNGNTIYVSVPSTGQERVYEPLLVTGILSTGGSEDDAVVMPLNSMQGIAGKPGQYHQLYVSALTKPEDDFARRNPATMNPDELERWSCSPYVSSIAYSIRQVLPGSDVRVIHRVADGEGQILTRVRTLLWLVTFASLLAAGLAVGASSAASVIERRTEIGLMKALGAGSGVVGFLLVAEQLLLALAGGGIGYALGIFLARLLGERIFGAAPSPSVLVFVVILLLAAVVTLLGSAVPLRRAARYQPAPILRGE